MAEENVQDGPSADGEATSEQKTVLQFEMLAVPLVLLKDEEIDEMEVGQKLSALFTVEGQPEEEKEVNVKFVSVEDLQEYLPVRAALCEKLSRKAPLAHSRSAELFSALRAVLVAIQH